MIRSTPSPANVRPRQGICRTLLVALLGGTLWPTAGGATDRSFEALVQASPFVRRETRGAAAAPAIGTLEFRGVLESGGMISAGFFDQTTGESFWVPVRENPGTATGAVTNAPPILMASEYDPQDNRLRVNYQGRAFTLELARAFIGETPFGSASAEGEDVTVALAATLAAADIEPDFGDGETGRRFVLARFGAAPKAVPRDEGNSPALATRSRSGSRSPSSDSPAAIITPEPPPELPAYAMMDIAGDPAGTLAEADPWAGLSDDELLPADDDGGRRLLIRRRVGLTVGGRRVD